MLVAACVIGVVVGIALIIVSLSVVSPGHNQTRIQAWRRANPSPWGVVALGGAVTIMGVAGLVWAAVGKG